MYIFCNNYSEKLSEFHIHDDLYINRAYGLLLVCVCVCIIYSYNNEGTIGYRNSNTNIRRKNGLTD